MNKLVAIFTVLKQGSELTNAAAWKNVQTAGNMVAMLIMAIVTFLPVEVSQDEANTIGVAIATVVGLFNAYLTNATSAKVGVRIDPKPDAAQPAVPDDLGPNS